MHAIYIYIESRLRPVHGVAAWNCCMEQVPRRADKCPFAIQIIMSAMDRLLALAGGTKVCLLN